MKEAESALMSVVRIETFQRDRRARVTSLLAEATGFFFSNIKKELFLITNKHVVFKKSEHYFPDKLRLHMHADPRYFSKTNVVDIKLWGKNGEKIWRSSSSYPAADLVAIPIQEESLRNCFYLPFTKEDIFNSTLLGNDVRLGLQVLVLGYPLGFYDKMNHFPMARTAFTATWPWLDFNRQPCFLIDGRSHHGMSGSPVISATGSIRKNGKSEIFLLGTLSGEWEPLGLDTVWHASLIEHVTD